jgi:hypothetical protein
MSASQAGSYFRASSLVVFAMAPVSFMPHLQATLPAELQMANAVCIAAALFSEGGVIQLREYLPAHAVVEVLVGLDLPTSPAALDELLAWSCAAEKVTVRVWITTASYFHPKVYLVQQEHEWIAYVGSANCTEGGWARNEELNVRVDTPTVGNLKREWFAPRFAEGIPLTVEFAAAYRAAFAVRAAANEAARAAAWTAQQEWQAWLELQKTVVQPTSSSKGGGNALGRPVGTGQYFGEEHYAAFDGQKPRSKDAVTNRERRVVYDRLFELHQALAPQILAAGWELQPHYEEEHTVSSWKHGEYTEDALRAMWLNYGRSREEVKAFDERHMPMHFLRLEAIIFSDHFATWCRIGKDGAIDREIFKGKMRRPQNQQAFFALLQGLGKGYFVEVNQNKRFISRFASAGALADFVKADKQGYYFIIGKDYQPNDPALADAALVSTVLRDWALLYQVYLWMRYQ